MTNTTFYLKYRPQTLAELDQSRVREALTKIVSSGRFPHAFLFAGPKGTGKTSAARILAKIINCEHPTKGYEPCNKCRHCTAITKGTHLDVIELDAASNRGIDDIRSLKDKIILSPASAPKKVYIIDEAHMLTTEAANALLKTLEEPPPHVVFVLATTDAHKLPETVRSRLTSVIFTKAAPDEIKRQLARVAQGEKLKIKDEALGVIAQAAGGSFRDAVKILEQLTINLEDLSVESITQFLFVNRESEVESFIQVLTSRHAPQIIESIEKLAAEGVSLKSFLTALITRLHETLLVKVEKGEKTSDLVSLLKLVSLAAAETPKAPIPQLPFELAVVKWCAGEEGVGDGPGEKQEAKVQDQKPSATPQTPVPSPKTKPASASSLDATAWASVMSTARQKNTTIEALLRAAKPLEFDGKALTLGVYYQFHKERLEVPVNRRLLEEIVAAVFGSHVEVNLTLTEKEIPKTPEVPLAPAEDEDIISAAKEIFGN